MRVLVRSTAAGFVVLGMVVSTAVACDAPTFEQLGLAQADGRNFKKIEGKFVGTGQCGRLLIKNIDPRNKVDAALGWGTSTFTQVRQPGMAEWGGFRTSSSEFALKRPNGATFDCKVADKQWTCFNQYGGKTLYHFEGTELPKYQQ